jgi:hypothetical protein
MLQNYDRINIVGCNRNFDSEEQKCDETEVAKMKFLSFSRYTKLVKNENRTCGRSWYLFRKWKNIFSEFQN